MRKIYTILCTTLLSLALFSCSDDDAITTEGELETLVPTEYDASSIAAAINLDYPGLENVKKYAQEGKEKEAWEELLTYYRNRTDFVHPDFPNISKVKISEADQKKADDGLKHIFYVNDAYEPLNYGDDINWQYWPIKDNELRWQLHRMKWWQPMGKAYYVSKDEKYAKEWTLQYIDWIKKNPYTTKNTPGATPELIENTRFAWRPLEVSDRVQDQTAQFILFLNSESFTAEFLKVFIQNYARQAEYLINNYSKEGNHLLFEAQRLIYAGSCFPEMKLAERWRTSGVVVLQREMQKQVYEDGVQYELDLGYHMAAINIFYKALLVAKTNHFEHEFASWYYPTMRKMIKVVEDTSMPDYQAPMFSDGQRTNKKTIMGFFSRFTQLFPDDMSILYWSSDRKNGEAPQYMSSAFKKGGFFTFRNGWDESATQMVVKAGPPAKWHNQPDNGTFELYSNGRNFFPDTGAFVYGGDENTEKERAWYKQTWVHNTLTIGEESIETMNSKCLLWDAGKGPDILVTENQGYSNLKHRRSVFFVDKSFFVIVDEAVGKATGELFVNFHPHEDSNLNIVKSKHQVMTRFADNNNMQIKGFSSLPINLVEKQGRVSYEIRKSIDRKVFAFKSDKTDGTPARFISVIHPITNKAQTIEAEFVDKGFSEKGLHISVSINGKAYSLKYAL